MGHTGPNAAGRRRRRQILEFIQAFQQEHGYSPTQLEIREQCGPKNPNQLVDHLRQMEEDGVIKQTPKIARSLVVVGEYEDED